MNTRLICSALALVFAGAACANAATMSVDAGAPIQATLLPEVTIVASSARPDVEPTMRIAATAPLSVTLMPTVRVHQRVSEQLATVILPTVRVVAQVEPATDETLAFNGAGAHALPRVDAGVTSAPAAGFRASLMPQ